MTIASGVAKQLVYKKEAAGQWGTAPGTGSAQLLRRKTSDLNVVKSVIESDEMRSDYQVADLRHSGRSVQGTINGELSCKTYQDFIAASVRAAWATAVSKAGATTIAAVSDGFTDSGNAWLTAGFKIGHIIRFTGWTAGATANNSRNFLITGVTANKITGVFLDGTSIAVKAAGDTVVTTGFKTATVPLTGHTDDSFSIEHSYTDLDESELYLGCKVNTLGLKIPGSDKAQIDLGIIGKDVATASGASAPYYLAPTAETTTGILTCLNGALYWNGTKYATVTNCDLTIDGGLQPSEPVLGSTALAAVFPGRVRVSGQMTIYFENITFRDAFLTESPATLILALASGSSATAEAMSIMLPKVKLNGSTKDDGEKGLIQTVPFVALLDGAGGAALATPKSTIMFCDTEAV